MSNNQQSQDLFDEVNVNAVEIKNEKNNKINFWKFNFNLKFSLLEISLISIFISLAIILQYISNLLLVITFPFNINLSFLMAIITSYFLGFLKSVFSTIISTIINCLVWPPMITVWQMFLLNGILLPLLPCIFGLIFNVQKDYDKKNIYFLSILLAFAIVFISLWICNTFGLVSFYIFSYNENEINNIINSLNNLFKNLNLNIWEYSAIYEFINYAFNFCCYLILGMSLFPILKKLNKRYFYNK